MTDEQTLFDRRVNLLKSSLHKYMSPELNLSEINDNTLLGKVVVKAYPTNPEDTVSMLADLYRDNAPLVIKVIGLNNARKII